jgi:hypothetical protein
MPGNDKPLLFWTEVNNKDNGTEGSVTVPTQLRFDDSTFLKTLIRIFLEQI